MGSILDAIEEWFRGLLVSGIMNNLTNTFDSVNNQVGQIAHDVGQTPANFSPAMTLSRKSSSFSFTTIAAASLLG